MTFTEKHFQIILKPNMGSHQDVTENQTIGGRQPGRLLASCLVFPSQTKQSFV